MKFRFKRVLRLLLIFGSVIWLAGCCCIWMPGSTHSGPLPPLDPDLVTVRDGLERDLRHLAVTIGERNLHRRPEALARARDWIRGRFEADGHVTSLHTFPVSGRGSADNVIAEIRGSARPDEIVVVGAHYDTVVDCPGANDNGTGVVSLLQLSAMFRDRTPERTLRFVAFANEEPPYFHTDDMGSLAYARKCRADDDDIVAMISLETMGFYSDDKGTQAYPSPLEWFYPSEGNFITFVGNPSSMGLTRRCVRIFRETTAFPSEGAALPAFLPGVGWSDHWSFWQVGYDAVMVTDTAPFRYEHYHERTDTVDKVDFDRLARVTGGCRRILEELLNDG